MSSAVLAIIPSQQMRGPYLDHAADDELAALAAARGVQHVEAVLAVFAVLELEEDIVLEWTEALGADEAAVTVECPVAVDNLRLGLEPILAARTGDAVQVHDAWHVLSLVTAVSGARVFTRLSPARPRVRQRWRLARPGPPGQPGVKREREG